jgi:hypothetical protein
MPDPSKLAFSTAFDAFKNNDYKTGTIAISGTVGVGAVTSYSGSVTLDRSDSVTQIYFTTSVNSDLHSTGRNYLYTSDNTIQHSNGSTATFPGSASYALLFTTEYSGSTLTLKANTRNEFFETLTVVTETISFEVYTFVAPFDN